MVFPCDNRSTCPSDQAGLNLSTEAPDFPTTVVLGPPQSCQAAPRAPSQYPQIYTPFPGGTDLSVAGIPVDIALQGPQFDFGYFINQDGFMVFCAGRRSFEGPSVNSCFELFCNGQPYTGGACSNLVSDPCAPCAIKQILGAGFQNATIITTTYSNIY